MKIAEKGKQMRKIGEKSSVIVPIDAGAHSLDGALSMREMYEREIFKNAATSLCGMGAPPFSP